MRDQIVYISMGKVSGMTMHTLLGIELRLSDYIKVLERHCSMVKVENASYQVMTRHRTSILAMWTMRLILKRYRCSIMIQSSSQNKYRLLKPLNSIK